MLEVNAPLRYHHKRRPRTDAHTYAQVSRFLSPAVRSLMDEVHEDGRSPADDGTAATGQETVDVGLAGVDRTLADLWS